MPNLTPLEGCIYVRPILQANSTNNIILTRHKDAYRTWEKIHQIGERHDLSLERALHDVGAITFHRHWKCARRVWLLMSPAQRHPRLICWVIHNQCMPRIHSWCRLRDWSLTKSGYFITRCIRLNKLSADDVAAFVRWRWYDEMLSQL